MSTWHDLKENPRLRKIYEDRLKITRLIREYFWERGFSEPETPIAVRLPGQEPYLNPLPVDFHDPKGNTSRFYLHTSPEFAMKKLLAAGWNKIFQICKCFRDFEQFGGQHNTEFTMLEWYRAPGTYEEVMDDTEGLFKYIGAKFGVSTVKLQGRDVAVDGVWDRKSMKQVWSEFAGVDLDQYLNSDNMAGLARSLGYEPSAGDAYEDLFYKIFLNKIEPNLGVDRPVFIYDYPAQMSSLSKLCEHDSRYAERFELYIGGLELANAFGELLDADEQQKRLEGDRRLREKLGRPTYPIDDDFIAALRSGIPGNQAGGIALGVDRMVLLFTGAKDINEVIFQAVKDQIK